MIRDMSNNQLTSLPTHIGLLTSLSNMDLSDNQLNAMPTHIGLLTLLKSLFMVEIFMLID